MDELGRQLRDDAARIDVAVDPELEKRIEASLAAAERRPAAAAPRPRSRRFHVASALAGAAAAAVLVAVLLPDADEAGEPPAATPAYAGQLPNPIPLELRRADLTDPLKQELEHLESDARKVREKLERDLGVTL